MKTKIQKRKISGAELGSLGGKAVVKKKGKAYMKMIAKRGAKARWAKKLPVKN